LGAKRVQKVRGRILHLNIMQGGKKGRRVQKKGRKKEENMEERHILPGPQGGEEDTLYTKITENG